MGNINYIKLDIDDIMEILLEHYQERFQESEFAKGIFLGASDDELRFVAVFGEAEDAEIHDIDLKKIDRQMDYNGEHAFLRNNPDFYIV